MEKSWDMESDALLDSILTGVEVGRFGDLGGSSELDGPFSDTSSDSGCNLEQQLMSPAQDEQTNPQSPSANRVDVCEFYRKDEDDSLHSVNPVTNSPEEIRITTTQYHPVIHTGTTTIVLPVMNIRRTQQLATISPPPKRRRVSASSSDSGCDEVSPSPIIVTEGSHTKTKYPPLVLNEEERRLCEREAIRLPSHYPLSREEEKNLKRIRRKIRNKVSAQDSRKRKKEYVDAMEERVKHCTDQNEELHKKIELLETQNKTLAGQLRRLHQIIVNGGLKNSQTSTAMMVLLLSTALFLIPGFKEQSESKCELDITQAIKMPPMPGQSRSLLQFTPIKQEYGTPMNNAANNKKNVEDLLSSMSEDVKPPTFAATGSVSPISDHDYYVTIDSGNSAVAKGKSILDTSRKISYIEEDAPPQGYGPGKAFAAAPGGNGDVVERRINVTRGPGNQGMRTVVLHVPKDIK